MRYQFRNSEFHLKPPEIRKLITHASSPRDRLLVMLLAYTGIRRAEIRDLRKPDVDTGRRRLVIRRGKGGKQRIVFVPKDVVQHLDTHCSNVDTEYVFPGRNGGPMSLRNINYILARVGALARIKSPNPRYVHVGPHLLRHSFARNWKRLGGSLESLQKLLGHASLKTTLDVYGTESQDEIERNYRELNHRLVGES